MSTPHSKAVQCRLIACICSAPHVAQKYSAAALRRLLAWRLLRPGSGEASAAAASSSTGILIFPFAAGRPASFLRGLFLSVLHAFLSYTIIDGMKCYVSPNETYHVLHRLFWVPKHVILLMMPQQIHSLGELRQPLLWHTSVCIEKT